jgi:hypothetical protein
MPDQVLLACHSIAWHYVQDAHQLQRLKSGINIVSRSLFSQQRGETDVNGTIGSKSRSISMAIYPEHSA